MIHLSNPRTPVTADDLGRLPDHRSTSDLQMMADAIRALTGEDRLFFAVEVMSLSIMKLRSGDEAEDSITDMLLDDARQNGKMRNIASFMFTAMPEILDDFIEVTATHCTTGTDLTDEESVGGWNAKECAQAYASLYAARNGLSIPFGANVQ